MKKSGRLSTELMSEDLHKEMQNLNKDIDETRSQSTFYSTNTLQNDPPNAVYAQLKKTRDNIASSSRQKKDNSKYPKPVFHRAGEFEPNYIRKRDVLAETYLLKGDGFDLRERELLVRKPKPSYVTPYQPNLSASLVNDKEKNYGQHLLNQDEITLNEGKSESSSCRRKETDSKCSTRVRSKSASSVFKQAYGYELPHQRHHDIRQLKDTFNQSVTDYDRLKRDRENLTQYEKEALMLKKLKEETKKCRDELLLLDKKVIYQPFQTSKKSPELFIREVTYGYML